MPVVGAGTVSLVGLRVSYSVVGLDEGVVDGDNVDIVVLDAGQTGQQNRKQAR